MMRKVKAVVMTTLPIASTRNDEEDEDVEEEDVKEDVKVTTKTEPILNSATSNIAFTLSVFFFIKKQLQM